MHGIGYFLKALAAVLAIAIFGFMWIVIFRAILPWVSPDPNNPIARFIHSVSEPVLYPIRKSCRLLQAVSIFLLLSLCLPDIF